MQGKSLDEIVSAASREDWGPTVDGVFLTAQVHSAMPWSSVAPTLPSPLSCYGPLTPSTACSSPRRCAHTACTGRDDRRPEAFSAALPRVTPPPSTHTAVRQADLLTSLPVQPTDLLAQVRIQGSLPLL